MLGIACVRIKCAGRISCGALLFCECGSRGIRAILSKVPCTSGRPRLVQTRYEGALTSCCPRYLWDRRLSAVSVCGRLRNADKPCADAATFRPGCGAGRAPSINHMIYVAVEACRARRPTTMERRGERACVIHDVILNINIQLPGASTELARHGTGEPSGARTPHTRVALYSGQSRT